MAGGGAGLSARPDGAVRALRVPLWSHRHDRSDGSQPHRREIDGGRARPGGHTRHLHVSGGGCKGGDRAGARLTTARQTPLPRRRRGIPTRPHRSRWHGPPQAAAVAQWRRHRGRLVTHNGDDREVRGGATQPTAAAPPLPPPPPHVAAATTGTAVAATAAAATRLRSTPEHAPAEGAAASTSRAAGASPTKSERGGAYRESAGGRGG